MRRGIGWIDLSNGYHRTSRVFGDLLSLVSSRVNCGPARVFLRSDCAAAFSKALIPFQVVCGHPALRVFGPNRRSSRNQTEDYRALS
jgi:hypothetical protein